MREVSACRITFIAYEFIFDSSAAPGVNTRSATKNVSLIRDCQNLPAAKTSLRYTKKHSKKYLNTKNVFAVKFLTIFEH